MAHTDAGTAPVCESIPSAAGPDTGPGIAAVIVHLLAPFGLFIATTATLLVVFGTSESLETGQWVLAYGFALPLGTVIAARQARGLTEPAAAWSLALTALVLGSALVWLRATAGDPLHHGIVGLAGALALTAPSLLRRRATCAAGAAYRIAGGVFILVVVVFLPVGALTGPRLLPTLVVQNLALVLLLAGGGTYGTRRSHRAADVVLVALLLLIVPSFPDIRNFGYFIVHHQDFYLGPVNDMRHGRPMLDGTWSQYGVAALEALRALFWVVPFGYGGLSLIVVASTVAQYLVVYATLRAAIRSQMIVALVLATDIATHLLGMEGSYLAVPSTSPLRFGFAYVAIALAVAAARTPARARRIRQLELATVAGSAVWSFETFAYTASTFGLIVLVSEIAAGPGAARRVCRTGALAVAVSGGGVLVYTAITATVSGGASWGPYFDYLQLYSSKGFGQLPIAFFSPGPLMGTFVFLSVAGTLHLARTRSPAASPELLVALAGFGGAAASFYTYYLGRSHPNNLLHILLPTVALGGLWASMLLESRPSTSRLYGLAALMLAGAMMVVSSWPTAKLRWPDTALAEALPASISGGPGPSLGTAVSRLWHQPVFDSRAVSGAALLARHLKPAAPALVLTEPDLSTEILIRSGRRNVLPIANPLEDTLLRRNDTRVRETAEGVPEGTLLLTTPAPRVRGRTGALGGNPLDFARVQRVALGVLHRRFVFTPVELTRDGLRLVRLIRR